MERGDNSFLAAIGLVVAGAFIFSGAFIYLVMTLLDRTVALLAMAVYGIMLVVTAFAVKNKEHLGGSAYGYIVAAYLTLTGGSLSFIKASSDSTASVASLVLVYAIPLIFLAQAWVHGKKNHLY